MRPVEPETIVARAPENPERRENATEARTPDAALAARYRVVRKASEDLCGPLRPEDTVVQPMADVSPPKWHLGHVTWFFETFVLKEHLPGYRVFDPRFDFVFNSYYETVGARVPRADRGNLSRPSLEEVYRYRRHVDDHMERLFASPAFGPPVAERVILGLHHEQQHQELLLTDIKYILGHNPLLPAYSDESPHPDRRGGAGTYRRIPEGVYEIGHEGAGFCFDNERGRHKAYLHDAEISETLVTNREYLAFIAAGGYEDFRFWHADGWDWVKRTGAEAPLYWRRRDGRWAAYTLEGLQALDPDAAVCHVNFYEASAFAAWKGQRLPTEFEWEVAATLALFRWGERWEWTGSAYLPYPGFEKAAGALGEYNGKFMVNQMVLRGSSVATPEGHGRKTYRNFFQPHHQWQFSGIRLAR